MSPRPLLLPWTLALVLSLATERKLTAAFDATHTSASSPSRHTQVDSLNRRLVLSAPVDLSLLAFTLASSRRSQSFARRHTQCNRTRPGLGSAREVRGCGRRRGGGLGASWAAWLEEASKHVVSRERTSSLTPLQLFDVSDFSTNEALKSPFQSPKPFARSSRARPRVLTPSSPTSSY